MGWRPDRVCLTGRSGSGLQDVRSRACRGRNRGQVATPHKPELTSSHPPSHTRRTCCNKQACHKYLAPYVGRGLDCRSVLCSRLLLPPRHLDLPCLTHSINSCLLDPPNLPEKEKNTIDPINTNPAFPSTVIVAADLPRLSPGYLVPHRVRPADDRPILGRARDPAQAPTARQATAGPIRYSGRAVSTAQPLPLLCTADHGRQRFGGREKERENPCLGGRFF